MFVKVIYYLPLGSSLYFLVNRNYALLYYTHTNEKERRKGGCISAEWNSKQSLSQLLTRKVTEQMCHSSSGLACTSREIRYLSRILTNILCLWWASQVALVVKNQPANAGEFDPWVGKIPQKRKWQPTPVFVAGKSHRQKSLDGCSSQGHKESDTTEHTAAHCAFDGMFCCDIFAFYSVYSFTGLCWISGGDDNLKWS